MSAPPDADLFRVRAGYLASVGGAHHVDAGAGALLRGVDHIQAQSLRNIGLRAGSGKQFAATVLDVGESVDVEFEHLGRVLHAQPVAGALVLVDPDSKRLAHRVNHALRPVHRGHLLTCAFPQWQ